MSDPAPAPERPRSPVPWILGGVIALLAIGVAVSFATSTDERPDTIALPAGPAPPCPVGFVDRPGRADRLRARLRSTAAGAPLLDALGDAEVRFCFGEREVPVVTEGRLLLLDEGANDDELAARVGHLVHHVVYGMPFPDELPPDADCEAVVAQAVDREATAYALEVTLRRALGIEAPRYEFEAAFWQAEEGAREGVIADYLRAHPDGAPNLDGLVTGYRQRCETERAAGR